MNHCRICGSKLKPDVRSFNLQTGCWEEEEFNDQDIVAGSDKGYIKQMYCPVCGVIYRVSVAYTA